MGALNNIWLPQPKPKIVWGGKDAFTHMLVIGPTRCGKTSTILKPMIYQILMAKKRGKRVGLSVIEPKGDVALMVAETSRALNIPYTHVDPLRDDSHVLNVMEGDMDDITEATVVVLKSLFGKQEAFFATIQELSARKITQLLKTLHGDNINLMDVVMTIRDPRLLDAKVAQLKSQQGETDLVQFFETELLGAQRAEYQKYVMGLRGQLENITSNRYLKRIMMGKSSINLDQHFEEGGILAINTAMGKLRNAGDAFGQFAMMHLQSTTYRRPGTEATRIPHYLIVDEASRYMTPENERFLSIAAEYKTSAIFATQSLAQLEVESGKLSGKAMKQAFLTGCRNKIVFVGVGASDAKEMQEEFGKDAIIESQATFEPSLFLPKLLPKSYRDTEKEEYRYTYTQIMDGIPKYHYFYKMLNDGHPRRPQIGKGAFIPRDWREQLLSEEVESLEKGKFELFQWAKTHYEANVKRSKVLDQKEDEQLLKDDAEYEKREEEINSKMNDLSIKEPDSDFSPIPLEKDDIPTSNLRFVSRKKADSAERKEANTLTEIKQTTTEERRSASVTAEVESSVPQETVKLDSKESLKEMLQDISVASQTTKDILKKTDQVVSAAPESSKPKKKKVDDFFSSDEIK